MNEEIKQKCEMLEKQLKELTNSITDEIISKSTKEDKKEYLRLITELKTKIEILKRL